MRAIFIAALMFVSTGALAEVDQGPPNVPEFSPAFKNQTRAPEIRDGTRLAVRRIAQGFEHPWGIAVLPGGGYLVTERGGRLNHVTPKGRVTRIGGVPRSLIKGQGGLLDVEIAGDFPQSRRIFLTYTKQLPGNMNATAAGTGVLNEGFSQLSGFKDIFVQTPPIRSTGHYGSRIVVDGNVAYISLGDRENPQHVQDLRTTLGKVVRVTTDGRVPASNPYAGQSGARPEIWSHGHRNPQGLAMRPGTSELWALEHGPRGGDELNLVRPGRNYGWPDVSYGENYDGSPVGAGRSSANGVSEPRYYWDPVIAPGGFAFYEGSMFGGWGGDVIAAALGAQGIVRLKLNGDTVTGEARYLRQLGRVRDVAVDLDGAILLVTDDGNGGLFRVTPD